MALVVPAEPLGLDRHWSEVMLDIQTSLLTNVALVFNALGRGLGWAVTLGVVVVVLFARQRWVALLAFAITEALTSLSSTLLKILVGRPRPPDGLVQPVGSSFPSGHAAYAGATCVALVLLFTAPSPAGAGGGRLRRWESSGWHGAAPIFRCTGCPTSSPAPCLESGSRSQSSAPLNQRVVSRGGRVRRDYTLIRSGRNELEAEAERLTVASLVVCVSEGCARDRVSSSAPRGINSGDVDRASHRLDVRLARGGDVGHRVRARPRLIPLVAAWLGTTALLGRRWVAWRRRRSERRPAR